MCCANKVLSVDEAIAHIRSGSRLMLGEPAGAGEPACYVEALLTSGIGQLTLITNTSGPRGGLLKTRLFSSDQLTEFIGTYVGTTDESTQAYPTDSVRVAEFFLMGTWVGKVRVGVLGLSGVLVPVDVGTLDQLGAPPKRSAFKQTPIVDGMTYFAEPPLRVDVSTIRGWRVDIFGNVEFRGTVLQNQYDIAMVGDYTIVEVNEIVEVGMIPSEYVGCPGAFVNAAAQGLSLDDQHVFYRHHWTKFGRLPAAEV